MPYLNIGFLKVEMFKSKKKVISDQKNGASVSDVEAAIVKLKGSDRVGNVSQLLNAAGGAVAGVSVASAAAVAAGASTLFGSTTIATALGGVLVVSTPIGWVVGCALAGGAAAYGVSRLVRAGGRNDRIRKEIIERLSSRQKPTGRDLDSSQRVMLDELRITLSELVKEGILAENQAIRMLDLIDCGKLNVRIALERVRGMSAIV
jgi:hypothetical protein